MLKEPYRIIRWKPRLEQVHGQLYTCARPGRSKGLKAKRIPDEWVDAWVKGLPGSKGVIIVSLLGQKPGGKSEFSFYSFRGEWEGASERPGCPTFQEWLDSRYGKGRYRVLEYRTTDTEDIPPDTLKRVVETLHSLLQEGHTVILVDSGGIGRTGKVCRSMGFREG